MKKRYIPILMGLLGLLFAFPVSATKSSCNSDSYSSEVLKEEKISETCTAYEIKVSYDGTKTQGLSHYSIALPCGEVKNISNSENWKMVFGKDKTTGVYGLKVDDIHGFGERGADSFTLKFTWCSSSSCTKELGIVAYKFGRCVSYDTLSRDEDPDPTPVCSSLLASLEKKNVTCFGGNNGELKAIIQEGKEPITYNWSTGATSSTVQNLTAGIYTVTIKDADGNTLTLNQEVSSPPQIVITESVFNPTCSGLNNGTIELTVAGGTGGYTYAWSHGTTTQNLSNLAGGLYTVTVTDSIGCSAEKTFMLTNATLITAGSSLRHPTCTQTNGSINITPFGGLAPYTYLWSTGATTEDLQNVGAGNYTVKITDAAGCSAERPYTLLINNTLLVTPTITPTSCLGDNSGAIDLSIMGGTAPYEIKWLDGPTTEDRSGLTAGNYKVTVTDAGGCSTPLTVSVYKKPLDVSSTINQPTCAGGLGSISVTPTGGTTPYTYSWSNGGTGSSIEDLPNGIYSLTITDASGCSNTLLFGIFSPTAIDASGVVNNAQCGNEGSFAIDLTVFGGQFPYNYLWSTGATSEDLSGLNSGTYAVEIRDAFGCMVQKEFIIDPISINWSCLINTPTAPIVCKSAGNILSTGVVGATTYQWTVSSTDNSWSITSGSTDSSAVYTAGNPGSSATFTLEVTKNGCTQTCSYTVATGGCVERDNTGGGDPTSSNPCTTPPVVVEPEPEEPTEEEPTHGCKSRIVHVYPNPFREKVKLEWTAGKNDQVRLEIFDTHGNRLSVVYEGQVKAGTRYSFDWSAACHKGDTFYYRYTSSKSKDSGKLLRKK